MIINLNNLNFQKSRQTIMPNNFQIPHDSENVKADFLTQSPRCMDPFLKMLQHFLLLFREKKSELSKRLILMLEYSNIFGFVFFLKQHLFTDEDKTSTYTQIQFTQVYGLQSLSSVDWLSKQSHYSDSVRAFYSSELLFLYWLHFIVEFKSSQM